MAFVIAEAHGIINGEDGPYGDHSIPSSRFDIIDIVPEPRAPVIPEHVPDRVAAKMLEAEELFLSGKLTACALAYRSAMERALKQMFPDDKGTLYARIQKAETEKRFPKAMIDWLKEVKAFGNDAAHEYDWDATPEDAEAARDFANLFLTYAYTMPERVQLARKKREAAKTS